jgi:hypothetical protein
VVRSTIGVLRRGKRDCRSEPRRNVVRDKVEWRLDRLNHQGIWRRSIRDALVTGRPATGPQTPNAFMIQTLNFNIMSRVGRYQGVLLAPGADSRHRDR